ncbi:MAG: CoB--CoM heterodisulfide reductase iron-sulfur subunit A family protein [Marinilabiliaceae bacterium]|jgi:heterodisulfide reductase subunit A|nr:CoB--CoM heterodisulfide reductase iron-sulfur subunit A family protein [Marinilabiliaceae bacterium]
MNNPRIGVYVCWCGTNIAKMVDVEAVAKQVERLPDVVIARDYKYMCSDPGQDMIIKDIKEHKLDRVVVAACSPRIHELTFRKALSNAGLNQYMFQMANIREQVSWVHTDREKASRKALSLVAGAVNRIKWHESLDRRSVRINDATMILGGGVAGMSAALEIADAGKQVYLYEKSAALGGMLNNIAQVYPNFASASDIIGPMVEKVSKHPKIRVFLEKSPEDVFGYVGNFETKHAANGNLDSTIKFGAIIVATGLKVFDPSGIEEYGYGILPDVITSLEMEKLLKNGDIRTRTGRIPKHVAIIHCVGSRNSKYHEYCSRMCCMTALKQAKQIKNALPDCSVYELYADMRAIGKGCEEFYAGSFKDNNTFILFDQQKGMPRVRESDPGDNVKMLVEVHELMSGENIEVPADLVVLMVGQEAHSDAKKISHAVGVSMCGNQFFIEKHPKLDPVATTTEGVFVVGSCQSPKDIPDSISQARAAAARVLANISKGMVEVEVTTAETHEETCCGCQTCIKVCPYGAISFDPEKRISFVNEVLCKGCGTCGSACPTGAIRSRHFTDKQILAQIKGVMSTNPEPIEI